MEDGLKSSKINPPAGGQSPDKLLNFNFQTFNYMKLSDLRATNYYEMWWR